MKFDQQVSFILTFVGNKHQQLPHFDFNGFIPNAVKQPKTAPNSSQTSGHWGNNVWRDLEVDEELERMKKKMGK